MKRILLLLLLISTIAEAQIVNIPDANFKARLLSADVNNDIAKNLAGVRIKIDVNNDGQIQLSEALQVGFLDLECWGCMDSQRFSSLEGIQSFINLKYLDIYSHFLTTLDLRSLPNLEHLGAEENLLTSVNLDGLTMMKVLSLAANQLTVFDPTPFTQLENFNIESNNITTLNLTGLSNLELLQCGFNAINSLNLNDLTSLKYLYCNNTEISTLNLENSNDLENLTCSENLFLSSIFVKNGGNVPDFFLLSDCPNLRYICCNESQITAIQNLIAQSGIANCEVNSYCTFVPGGDYNTITGNTLFDSNGNGCEVSDFARPFIKMKTTDGLNTNATFTTSLGNYSFYTQAGNFAMTPEIENPTFFSMNPPSTAVNFLQNDNSVSINNFCITGNGVHSDLEFVIAPVIPARPGNEAVYKIVYKNIGNQSFSQNNGLNFSYNQNLMQFVSATTAPATQTAGNLNWNFSNLMPFESRSILITMQINGSGDANPVNTNDELVFSGSVLNPIDENPANNNFTLKQKVVSSFNPNDIQCLQGEILPPSEIGNNLHYMIRFKNTGSVTAQNIVVKTEINPAQFDLNSLQILATSHECYARVNNNKIEFIFKDVQMDSGGHGNVLLKIKSNSQLHSGDTVLKKSQIFFDYDSPIVTSEFETVFQALSINDFGLDKTISIYPNPSKEKVFIESKSTIKSVELFDLQGRLLFVNVVNADKTEINLATQNAGIYFIRITTENGNKVQKIIKE